MFWAAAARKNYSQPARLHVKNRVYAPLSAKFGGALRIRMEEAETILVWFSLTAMTACRHGFTVRQSWL
jgi:hypothetical protein